VLDRQTDTHADTQTHDDGIYRASIVSHSNNVSDKMKIIKKIFLVQTQLQTKVYAIHIPCIPFQLSGLRFSFLHITQ